jgi:hypothetical protein
MADAFCTDDQFVIYKLTTGQRIAGHKGPIYVKTGNCERAFEVHLGTRACHTCLLGVIWESS